MIISINGPGVRSIEGGVWRNTLGLWTCLGNRPNLKTTPTGFDMNKLIHTSKLKTQCHKNEVSPLLKQTQSMITMRPRINFGATSQTHPSNPNLKRNEQRKEMGTQHQVESSLELKNLVRGWKNTNGETYRTISTRWLRVIYSFNPLLAYAFSLLLCCSQFLCVLLLWARWWISLRVSSCYEEWIELLLKLFRWILIDEGEGPPPNAMSFSLLAFLLDFSPQFPFILWLFSVSVFLFPVICFSFATVLC